MENSFLACGLKHFALSVASLKESLLFYQRVFNLKLSEKRKNDIFFTLTDNSVFALIQYPGGKETFDKEMRPKKQGKAFTHFGFTAPSVKAIFLLEKFLIKENIPICKKAYKRWDGASMYFIDPNGYTLEYLYFEKNSKSK